jgi:hypothetical protein
MKAPDTRTDSVIGNWHLVDIAADERNIPQHRMDLRFETRGEQFRGAILHRVTGEEMLLAEAVFDGSELQLQMYAPPDKEQADMPWLVMTRIAGKFEGQWQNLQGEAMGPRLKLVRATA